MRLIIFVTLYCVATLASASSGMMDDLMTKAQLASGGWMTKALEYAKNLFFGLAAIEFAWSAIQLTLKKSELSEIMIGTLFKVMSLSFFAMVLIKAPEWIPAIIDSFKIAGAGVGGAAILSPSSVFDQGLGLAADLMKFSNDSAPSGAAMIINSLGGSGQGLGKFMLSSIIMGVAAVFIVLGYGLIAVQLLITLFESYLIIGGGAIMLGFSGSRWTHNLSEKYFGYAISVGAKLFTIYLIIGFGDSFTQALKDTIAQAYVAHPDEGPSFGEYLGIGGASLLYGVTGYMVPGLAGSMLNGSVSMSLQNTGAAAGMVAGAPVAATMSAGAAGARAIGLAAGGVASLLPVQKAAGAIGGASGGGGFGAAGAGISGAKPSGGGGSVEGSSAGNGQRNSSGANSAPTSSSSARGSDPAGSVQSAPGKSADGGEKMSMQEAMEHDKKKMDAAPQDEKIAAANKENSAVHKQESQGKSAEEIRATASDAPSKSENSAAHKESQGKSAEEIRATASDAPFKAVLIPPHDENQPKRAQSPLPSALAASDGNQAHESSGYSSSGKDAAADSYSASSASQSDSSTESQRPAFVDPKFDPAASPRSASNSTAEKNRAFRNETGGLSNNEAPQKKQRLDEPQTSKQKMLSTAQKFNEFSRKLQYAADRKSPHLVNDGSTGSAPSLRTGHGD